MDFTSEVISATMQALSRDGKTWFCPNIYTPIITPDGKTWLTNDGDFVKTDAVVDSIIAETTGRIVYVIKPSTGNKSDVMGMLNERVLELAARGITAFPVTDFTHIPHGARIIVTDIRFIRKLWRGQDSESAGFAKGTQLVIVEDFLAFPFGDTISNMMPYLGVFEGACRLGISGHLSEDNYAHWVTGPAILDAFGRRAWTAPKRKSIRRTIRFTSSRGEN